MILSYVSDRPWRCAQGVDLGGRLPMAYFLAAQIAPGWGTRGKGGGRGAQGDRRRADGGNYRRGERLEQQPYLR
jgi:hypothetical protein